MTLTNSGFYIYRYQYIVQFVYLTLLLQLHLSLFHLLKECLATITVGLSVLVYGYDLFVVLLLLAVVVRFISHNR